MDNPFVYHIDALDEHLRVWIDFEANTIDEPRSVSDSQNAMEMREYNGYAIDCRMDGCQGLLVGEWEDLAAKIRPLVAQIHEMGEEDWNGHNHVFEIGDEGKALKAELENLIMDFQPAMTIEVWEAGDWIGPTLELHRDGGPDYARVTFSGEKYVITADTSDVEITTIGVLLEAEASATQIILNMRDTLTALRDTLATRDED